MTNTTADCPSTFWDCTGGAGPRATAHCGFVSRENWTYNSRDRICNQFQKFELIWTQYGYWLGQIFMVVLEIFCIGLVWFGLVILLFNFYLLSWATNFENFNWFGLSMAKAVISDGFGKFCISLVWFGLVILLINLYLHSWATKFKNFNWFGLNMLEANISDGWWF